MSTKFKLLLLSLIFLIIFGLIWNFIVIPSGVSRYGLGMSIVLIVIILYALFMRIKNPFFVLSDDFTIAESDIPAEPLADDSLVVDLSDDATIAESEIPAKPVTDDSLDIDLGDDSSVAAGPMPEESLDIDLGDDSAVSAGPMPERHLRNFHS